MTSRLMHGLVLATANLKTLRRRFWISASMTGAIALVVCVLLGFLGLAKGFEQALVGTGASDVAIVLGAGARDEIGSRLEGEDIHRVEGAPATVGIARDRTGRPFVSRELVVPVEAISRADDSRRTLSLRGVGPEGLRLRSGLTLLEGRMPSAGAPEIAVGSALSRVFRNLALGDRVAFGAGEFTVVGVFSAGGSAFETEILADIEVVQALFDRAGEVHSLRVLMNDADRVAALRAYLEAGAAAPLGVFAERDFYAAQSERMSRLIRLFAWPLAMLMAIGATAGALNTMYSSVSDRAVETATVRALGFSRLSAFVGTWLEALVLTLVGVVIGTLAALVLLDGLSATTTGPNDAQMTFALSVTPDLLIQAGLLALAIGAIGGALPAIRAARVPIATAMNARG